ncbi:MAG: antibiotic biosynthesis monooxygenase [Shinella sp.]|nr:antibiotic biosynthesis monooxygenase [Shinella sp.]
MDQDQFALVVDIKTKPGLEQEYERLMLEVVERQTAEPTYVGMSVHRDPDDPTHFMLYEAWRDRKDFETVQMKRSYRRNYEETLERLPERPCVMSFHMPTWSQGRLPKAGRFA